ncbi:MAG TPA: hypothetical protein PKI03_29985, partial [Pseudomonadota bacterium]|nr:hypothetical protein [Pseudomonadota bacterium]
TELLEGETLRARLNRGPLRAERALSIVTSVARTLEAAHKVGLVHGDLRPENIFLVRTTAKNASAGRVMVVEHAMHHLRRRAAGLDDRLPLYKHLYRPPEQVAGMIGATERGDVFVLGAILHECLTARPAFFAEEIEFILENLASPPPPLTPSPATGLSRELAEALTLLIRQACALQLEDRVPSMSELIEGIDQIVRGYGLKLPEPPVEAKDEVTLPAKAPTAESQSMSRLLQRMSGVFPQIALPPTGSPVTAPIEPTPAAGTDPAGGPAAVRISTETAASIPRLEPLQQERVSRILKRLSGAFPTIAPPASDGDGGAGPAASPPVAAASSPSSVVVEALPPAPALPVVASSAATPIPGTSLPLESASPPPPVATPESAVTDPRVALPVLPVVAPVAASLAVPATPPSNVVVGAPSTVAPDVPPVELSTARPPVAATPERPAASPRTATPSPVADIASAPATGLTPVALGPLPAVAVGAGAPVPPLGDVVGGISEVAAGSVASRGVTSAVQPALSPVPANSPSAGNPGPVPQLRENSDGSRADATAASPSLEGGASSALPSGTPAQSGAAAAEQPITAPILPHAKLTSESASTADAAAPAAVLPPTLVGALLPLPTAVAVPETPTRPRLEVSTELAVPPLPIGSAPPALLPAPVVLLPLPLSIPPPAAGQGGGIAAPQSPFGSGAIPSLQSAAQPALPSLISSAPTAVQIPKPVAPPRETTLAGDDLAEMLEPSQPAIPQPSLSPPALPVTAGVAGPGAPTLGPSLVEGAAPSAAREAPRAAASDIGALRTVAQIEALPAPSPSSQQPGGTSEDRGRAEGRPLAELATRPALAALAERMAPLPPRINELPTQPAVRRLPITELATQARLNVSADGIEVLNPSLLEDAHPSLPPTPAAGNPVAAPPHSETLAVSGRAPAPSGGGTASPAAPTLQAGSGPTVASPPASPSAVTAPERAPTPRPPRVSQLIAALQNQQGPLKPAPEPDPAPPANVPPASPKATGGQPRGLMPPSPEALAPLISSSETPALASSVHAARVSPAAVPALTPSSAPVSRLVELALRHQEITAAGLGAVLVLLITLLYLVVVR